MNLNKTIEVETNNITERQYFYQFKSFLKSGKSFPDYIKTLNNKQLSKLKNSIEILPLAEKEKLIKICIDNFRKVKKYHPKYQETLKLKTVENKINRLKSKRTKLAFRLQEISGLRIAELTELTEKDIKVAQDGKMMIHVKNGKGSKERFVKVFKDDYVLEGLLNLKPKKNGKLFNSRKYMLEKAKQLGFKSHDLRKTYAETFFNNCLESKIETIDALRENLGHSPKNNTYKIYLRREINTYMTKIEGVKPFSLD
jgi:integrase